MYVAFEGSNGVGKSTQIPLVLGYLDQAFKIYGKFKPMINSFHEGDTCKENHENWYDTVLDYAQERAELQHLIHGSDSAHITISDRSYYSSIVYQGQDDPYKINYIRTANVFAHEPDLVIFMVNNTNEYYTKLYRKVLPYESLYIEFTRRYTIKETTLSIGDTIFNKWLVDYENMDIDKAFDISLDIMEQIGE